MLKYRKLASSFLVFSVAATSIYSPAPIYAEESITVTYNGNGGTINGSSSYTESYTMEDEDSEITVGGDVTAERDGFYFSGWSTEADAEVGSDSVDVSDSLTLYAVWSEDDGTTDDDTTGGDDEDTTSNPDKPDRPDDADVDDPGIILYSGTGEFVDGLKAKWLIYTDGDGDWEVSDGIYYLREFPELIVVDEDYTFSGWAREDDTDVIVPVPFTYASETQSYIAVFTKNDGDDDDGDASDEDIESDSEAPTIDGVEDGVYYNSNVQISISDDVKLEEVSLDDELVDLDSNTATTFTVSTAGTHTISATDAAGNVNNVEFFIDKTAPKISGVVNGRIYKSVSAIEITDASPVTATLNGKAFESGSGLSVSGTYTLTVIDAAENETEVEFIVDSKAPTFSGVANGKWYKSEVSISFDDAETEATATLNNKAYESGDEITKDGTYTFVVSDQAGNKKTATFYIDKTVPKIAGDTSGYVKKNTTLTVTEKNLSSITVDGKTVSSAKLTTAGAHKIVVKDKAGNSVTKSVTVDVTAPKISTIKNGSVYNKNVKLTVTDKESGLKTMLVNNKSKKSGTTLSSDGKYTIKLTDKVGNAATYTISVDKTAPKISGVAAGKTYKTAKTVKIKDAISGLKSVKVDGVSVSVSKFKSGYKISGKKTHKIVATDKAGNSRTLSFKIK